jgi:hypothetical protein
MKHQSWMIWKWEQETCFPHGAWQAWLSLWMRIIFLAVYGQLSNSPNVARAPVPHVNRLDDHVLHGFIFGDGDLFQVYPWWRIVPMRIQLSQLSMSWGVIIPRIHDFLVVSPGSLGIGPGRSRPNTSWSRLPRAAACCVVVGNMAAQRRPSGDRSLFFQMMESKNPRSCWEAPKLCLDISALKGQGCCMCSMLCWTC